MVSMIPRSVGMVMGVGSFPAAGGLGGVGPSTVL
jgi:hypothetical protein